jgi:hypothetical protein
MHLRINFLKSYYIINLLTFLRQLRERNLRNWPVAKNKLLGGANYDKMPPFCVI